MEEIGNNRRTSVTIGTLIAIMFNIILRGESALLISFVYPVYSISMSFTVGTLLKEATYWIREAKLNQNGIK